MGSKEQCLTGMEFASTREVSTLIQMMLSLLT